jgi:hypothetical protein
MRARITPWLAGTVVLAAACGGEPTAPINQPKPEFAISLPPSYNPTAGNLLLCKIGTAATFDVTIGSTTTNVSLNDGDCQIVGTFGGNPRLTGTATEIIPPNTVLDSIVKIHWVDGQPGVFPLKGDTTVFTGTNTASATFGDEDGSTLIFFNHPVPPPGGGEGCTPGYWKQSQHFGNWTAPYDPTDLFSSVFEDAFPGKTLLDVLKLGGGGLNALGRHTVAALLNAASPNVDYDLTTTQVIDMFNAVFPGTDTDYETLKNQFEAFNEQGCPL